MRFSLFLFFFFGLLPNIFAQPRYAIKMGPMPGHFTDSSEIHWYLLRELAEKEEAYPTLEGEIATLKERFEVKDVQLVVEPLLEDLKVGRLYVRKLKPTVKQDTIEFLTGSCAFQYPFPLNAGGKRRRINRIFAEMAEEDADFMVWTGDNVYYLAGEWNSYEKMVKKNLKSRLRSPIKEFLESCPQYAIWDDHDYGPNDSDARFELKDTALKVFKKFWANPYYGTDEAPGVYTHFSYGDCDFFLLDSRYHNLKKGENPKLLGDAQMQWLEEKLKASKANFKFVFNGTQFIPVEQPGETWGKYTKERQSFFDFLEEEAITGVVFMSGDRHYTELNKLERQDSYPLYEFTCSPLTSFMDPSFPKFNDYREPGTALRDQNYGRIKIYNDGVERVCLMETFNTKGELVWQYFVNLSELK